MRPFAHAGHAMAKALSGVAGRVGRWTPFPSRSLRTWMCLVCGLPNEPEINRCWSCGRPFGEIFQDASHIPPERRWACLGCATWNGVLRAGCWRCGRPRPEPRRPARP